MKIVTLLLFLFFAVRSDADELHRVIDLRGQWKFSIGDNPRWAGPEFDDSGWQSIFVPASWENEGFSGFDGYAWYRVTIELKNITENNLFLVLGYIDDVDEVYLNGHLIGFTGSFPPNFYTAYQSHRQYHLPADLLNRHGKNTIAVRVYDTIHEGGIVKGDIGIYTKKHEPENTFSLEGIWKFREGDNQWWKEMGYEPEYWDHVMVPGFWGSLKDKHISGTAWYYKQFTLPEYLRNEQHLVLVLGMIDDFDETYFNGRLIGSTNDGKPLGWSESWHQYRIYPIPDDVIRRSDKNTIAVRVRDIGGNAGIYKGPLAILPEKDVWKLIGRR